MPVFSAAVHQKCQRDQPCRQQQLPQPRADQKRQQQSHTQPQQKQPQLFRSRTHTNHLSASLRICLPLCASSRPQKSARGNPRALCSIHWSLFCLISRRMQSPIARIGNRTRRQRKPAGCRLRLASRSSPATHARTVQTIACKTISVSPFFQLPGLDVLRQLVKPPVTVIARRLDLSLLQRRAHRAARFF